MAVHGHAVAGLHWTGDGIQRLGCNGEGALRIAVRIPGAADGVGGGRADRYGRRDERELQTVPPADGGIHVSGHYISAADCGVLLPRLAQHASLDQVRRPLVPALRGRKTGADPVSRLLPRIALAADYRHQECAAPGSSSHSPVRAADRQGARPRHGARVCGYLDGGPLHRGYEHEISLGRSSGFPGTVVLPHRPRAVAMGPYAGLLRSFQGPPGQRLPHHPIDDRREHRWNYWTRPDGGQAETLLPPRTAHRLHL